MLIYSDYQGLPDAAKGVVVALGNFDGVHLGHAALLAAARAAADARSLPLAVLTFEPHPRLFFRPDEPPFRLTTAKSKAALLEKHGVDILYVLKFDETLSLMSANDFQDRVLKDGIGAKAIAAGPNFRFGYGREGNLAGLAARDDTLEIVKTTIVLDQDGGEVSSTRVRDALAVGAPRQAAALLGRWWEIEYEVETGDRRGRELGYPTANGRLGNLIRPAYGIYAVMARLDDGRIWKGAANIGVRPMWQSDQPLVEAYLFDMSENIYERRLSISLIDYLRPEARFADIESLKEQMARDCEQARAFLSLINI